MTSHLQASLWILLLTSATLFWVALTDFRNFKIRNEAVLVLAGLYFLYAAASGRWASVPWNVGFAILMLAGMTYIYAVNKMGGGDLKLLAVAFLWTGPWSVLPFALLLLVFVGSSLSRGAARLGGRGEIPGGSEDSPRACGGGGAHRRPRVGFCPGGLTGRDQSINGDSTPASISRGQEEGRSSGSPERCQAPAA